MKVWLTGASGVLGPVLCRALAAAGYEVHAISRTARSEMPVCRTHQGDLTRPSSLGGLPAAGFLVHAAPLWLAPALLPYAAAHGVRRAVLLSSTSVITKSESGDPADREIAMILRRAEEDCARVCAEGNVALTLLRPTMIYGYGRDRNISSIAHFIRRFRFFPVAGEARGCRQPVHAEDLASAAVSALGAMASAGRTYSLGGGERLSYKEMIGRVFDALRLPRRIVSVPVPLYRGVLALRHRLKGGHEVSAGAAGRMNEDLCFDNADAERELGFRPREFLGDPARDLP